MKDRGLLLFVAKIANSANEFAGTPLFASCGDGILKAEVGKSQPSSAKCRHDPASAGERTKSKHHTASIDGSFEERRKQRESHWHSIYVFQGN